MWTYRAQVTDVHDGDTLTVLLDLGFSTHRVETALRLVGVYAPELSQTGGPETRDFVKAWVASLSTSEWPFVVTTSRIKSDAHEVMTLGRYVGTVTDASGSRVLNAEVNAFVAAHGYGGGIGAS